MSKIADLLAELSRNEDRQPCYNGVSLEETEIAYQRILDKLYNDAVVELFSVSIDKNLLIKRMGEIQDSQSCFYCPSKFALASSHIAISFLERSMFSSHHSTIFAPIIMLFWLVLIQRL